MLRKIRGFVNRVSGCDDGNATLLVALGMPVLIGGAGLSVDVTQWYMWKRELQFAVDQAAIAAAYAYSEDDTRDSYQTRASQEFAANLTAIDGITTTPAISLVDYDSGSDNAVEVSASASKLLPFTGIFSSTAASVTASAWATWEGGSNESYTSCIIALDPSASRAVWFNGGPDLNAGCGVTALSDASNAIEVSGGSGTLDLGWLIARGGIDDYFDDLDNTTVLEGAGDITNPFADLVPPDNATPREFTCPGDSSSSTGTSASYTITYSVTRVLSDKYYRGSKRNNMTLQSTTQTGSTTTTETETGSASATVGAISSSTSTQTGTETKHGNGRNSYYDRTDVETVETREVVSVVDNNGGAAPVEDTSDMLLPGTYSDFDVSCDVTLAGGIYVIDGGDFSINAGDSITGNGVMFVLKNGAGIKINGGGEVNLTAMTETELIAAGVSADHAPDLVGMLIFEDPESEGNTKNKINGNSETGLNGTVYLPNSGVEILGTAGVTSRCLTIAAATVKIGGTADLTNLCPVGLEHDTVVLEGGSQIRLVA